MKTQQPNQLKPRTNEFFKWTDKKISLDGQKSIAWQSVLSLFQTSEKFYKMIDSFTSERLSIFVDNKTYLTPRQEHDAVALTAHFAANLDMQLVRNIVGQDQTITDDERQVLLSTVDLFHSSVAATIAAMGSPRWVDS